MTTENYSEKSNLFFQYLLLFVITGGAILLALFFTHDIADDIVPESERPAFNKFVGNLKTETRTIKIIDSITTDIKKIKVAGAEGGELAYRNANNNIKNLFNDETNSIASKVPSLLNTYLSAVKLSQKLADDIVSYTDKIKTCNDDLKEKKMNERLDQLNKPAGSPN